MIRTPPFSGEGMAANPMHDRSRELIFLHANRTRACSAVVNKHFEGYCTVQFMESGSLSLSYDNHSHRLDGAWFWFAMPGPHIRFTTATGEPWNHRYAAFRGKLAQRWQKEGLIHTAPIACPVQSTPRAASHFDELLRQIGNADSRHAYRKAVNLLENLLIDIEELRQGGSATAAGQMAGYVRDRLASAIAEPLDYAGLAKEYRMGLSTFRRAFRRETGIALHRYITAVRIGQAQRLLVETDLPIKEIADTLGFSDVYYFSRCFKRGAGLPPAEYRRTRL